MNETPLQMFRLKLTNNGRLPVRPNLRAVASALGVSAGNLSVFERGERMLGMGTRMALAELYGCTVEDLDALFDAGRRQFLEAELAALDIRDGVRALASRAVRTKKKAPKKKR